MGLLKRVKRRHLLLIFLTPLLAGQVSAAESGASVCHEKKKTQVVYVRRGPTYAHQSPSASSPVLFQLDVGSGLEVDPIEYAEPSREWIRWCKIDTEKLDGKVLWVSKKNLIRYVEMSPIHRCWPISRVFWSEGDYAVAIHFDISGLASIADSFTTETSRVRSSNGLAVLETQDGSLVFKGIYSREALDVKPIMGEGDVVIDRFPPSSLEGCGQ